MLITLFLIFAIFAFENVISQSPSITYHKMHVQFNKTNIKTDRLPIRYLTITQDSTDLKSLFINWEPEDVLVNVTTARDIQFKSILTRSTIPPKMGKLAITFDIPIYLIEETLFVRIDSSRYDYCDARQQNKQNISDVKLDFLKASSCSDDFFLNNHASNPFKWRCQKCPPGAACYGPVVWNEIKAKHGWWRVKWSPKNYEMNQTHPVDYFLPCHYQNDCLGITKNDTKVYKKNNPLRRKPIKNVYEGCANRTNSSIPMCAACKRISDAWADNYYRTNSECWPCKEKIAGMTPKDRLLALTVISLLLFVLFLIFRKKLRVVFNKYRSFIKQFFKIISIQISFAQVSTSLPNTLPHVPFPESYRHMLEYFEVFNFDIQYLGLSCFGNYNYYWSFGLICAIPICVCFLGWIAYLNESRRMTKLQQHFTQREVQMHEEEALHLLFKLSDSDNSGHVEPIELCGILENLGWEVEVDVALLIIHALTSKAGTYKRTTKKGNACLHEAMFIESLMTGSMETLLHQNNVQRKDKTEVSFAAARQDQREDSIVDMQKQQSQIGSGDVGRSSSIKKRKRRLLRKSTLSNRSKLITWTLQWKVMASALAGTFQFLLLMHTPVSRKAFQFLDCIDIEDQWFLRVDYTIRCEAEWYAFLPFVWIVIVLFAIGLPGFLIGLLFLKRHTLHSTSTYRMWGWLYNTYQNSSFWWEPYEHVTMLALTSILMFLPQEIRTAVALSLCMLNIGLLNYYQPHKSKMLFWLTEISFIMSTSKYFVAQIISGNDKSAPTLEAIGNLMVVCDLIMVLLSCLSMIFAFVIVRQEVKQKTEGGKKRWQTANRKISDFVKKGTV